MVGFNSFSVIPAEGAALAEPVVVTTPGYSYEEPANPLPVRPVTTTLAPAPTTPLALYGAPARTGRRGRNFRRGPRR